MSGTNTVAGRIATALGLSSPDSAVAVMPLRVNGYGELCVRQGGLDGLAEEGSLYVARNATIGTGLVWVANHVAFDATKPNFHIQNLAPAGGKKIQIRSLKLVCTAPATAATAIHYAVVLDPSLRSLTTDNCLAVIPTNVNGGSSASVEMTLKAHSHATASVLSAASSGARVMARGTLGGLNIAGDELEIRFGGAGEGSLAQTAVAGAGLPSRRVSAAPPVIIAPQQSLSIFVWMPDSSDSFDPEFELCFSAR